MEDALVRQRHIWDSLSHLRETETAAMIADLEHLAKIQQASVHNGQILTTTERREEILRMLSNMGHCRIV
jgi:hypothetical protein